MLTWGDLRKMVLLEVGEDVLPDNGLQSINAALRTLALHWAHSTIWNATVTTGALLLPYDYLQMHAVRAVTGGKMMVNYKSIPDDTGAGMGWYDCPHGTLQFPAYRGDVQVFHYAYYPEITANTGDSEIIPVPMWSTKGLLIMASAYLLFPEVVSDAALNQFNTRLDSGNPEDIPLLVTIKFLRAQYLEELRMWPKQDRQLYIGNAR